MTIDQVVKMDGGPVTIDQVVKLTPVERFLYWCEERHRIYLRRRDGASKPWTDDAILREYYFTNVYRELDKTTVWFRENVRDPLAEDPRVLMATIIFRWFNYIPTGKTLVGHGLLRDWNPRLAFDLLDLERRNGRQIFTGAFMINSPAGRPKLEAIIDRINAVWVEHEHLLSNWWANGREESPSMEGVCDTLQMFEGLGSFMSYEIVCDLRFTHLLRNAPDKLFWANPGPGAIRGMYRLLGRELTNKSNSSSPRVPPEWAKQIILMREQLQAHMTRVFGPSVPPIEAREVEMSLCEYDKYVRLLLGEGQSKRRYHGGQ